MDFEDGIFSFCWWSDCLIGFLLLDRNDYGEERPLLYSVSLEWFRFVVSRLIEEFESVALLQDDGFTN